MLPDDPPESAANAALSRPEFETLIADLSSEFINLPPGDLDREIEHALGRVCDALGLDAAVLWQWSARTPGTILPTHAYPALGDSPPFDPLVQARYPWVSAQMLAGNLVRISRLDEVPAEGAVDRESARASGIRSNLTLPLSLGGEAPVGALAVNTLRAERHWSDAVVKRLQLIAQIFTHALARRRADQAVRESTEVNRATFEQAAVGIAHVGIDGRWLRINDRLCAILGYSREELLPLTFQDITHPDDLEADLENVRQVASGETATYTMEKRYIRKDGSVLWANLTVSLARTATGEPRHFISIVEDISERRRTREALRASEARLAAGADLAGLAFYEVDLRNGATYLDDRFRDICGVPPECESELRALDFWIAHLHPDDRPVVMEEREKMHGGRLDRISVEYRYLHRARGERWIDHIGGVAERGADGRATRTFGVLRDVTERKRSEDELRNLSRRLIRAQEEERAMLARELHDDVTQRLAVLAIDAGRAEFTAQSEAQAATLATIREGLVHLSEDIHSLAYHLHPSVLEELGLAEALRAECERRGRHSGLDISLDLVSSPLLIGKDAALCLYRVAQEALSNVAKHAQARAASVVLRHIDGGLLLAVRDDGVGFDLAGPKRGRSLGLAGMRERLQVVNGTLEIESAPGEGTSIIAWVPDEGASL